MYLQESQYDFGVENDPESFLQAINSCNSKLWYDAMNDELESITNNKCATWFVRIGMKTIIWCLGYDVMWWLCHNFRDNI